MNPKANATFHKNNQQLPLHDKDTTIAQVANMLSSLSPQALQEVQELAKARLEQNLTEQSFTVYRANREKPWNQIWDILHTQGLLTTFGNLTAVQWECMIERKDTGTGTDSVPVSEPLRVDFSDDELNQLKNAVRQYLENLNGKLVPFATIQFAFADIRESMLRRAINELRSSNVVQKDGSRRGATYYIRHSFSKR